VDVYKVSRGCPVIVSPFLSFINFLKSKGKSP